MYEIEPQVKQLILNSLEKRLAGTDHVDNIRSNFALLSIWMSDIMALGFNHCDVNEAAWDLYQTQIPFMGEQSIEDLRARLFFTINRFTDEVLAFQAYVDNRDTFDDVIILRKVQEHLADIEPGDFMLA